MELNEFHDEKSRELLIKAANGDNEAMSALVEKNTGLVWSVVKRFTNRGVEPEDLYQIGTIGLMKAIRNFDTSYNVCFSTYAVPMIAGEIKRYLRDDGIIKISRQTKELYVKAKGVSEIMSREKGREPTLKELAERLDVDVETLTMALEAGQTPESIYAVTNDNDSSPLYLIDKLADENTQGQDNDMNELLERMALVNAIKKLDKTEQQIIILRYFKEMTQVKIAELLGLSQVQVSRLEKKILKKIRNNLDAIN
ncbi:MAG TPA: RNA polymerase sporulation sigma factor, SigF/SigG family [Clostridiaceae bacterium]|jgi:RNA polymerase sporulation-specific sigma factor|nr:RNA polymerase sporulation sigma factor, SigF/SigG family [Clostridiaceae bacterium]